MKNENISILLIEDNPDDARMIKELLSEISLVSFSVDLSDRLSDGIDRAGKDHYDAVLLDLGLPDSRGLDTFTKLQTAVNHLPIVVLSGLDDESVSLKSVQAGAQDYLMKGQVDKDVLWRSIRYAIERKRAEETLRKSEEKFRNALENAPDAIYINDLNGNFLYGNKKAEEIVGYQREALIGKNFMELNLLSAKDLTLAAEVLRANSKGESTGPDEIELVVKDGRCVPLEISTTVLRSIEQPVVLSFARDITERKLAEKALRERDAQYRLLADHVTDTVWLMDMNLKTRYQSPSVQKLRGFTPQEITDLPLEKQLTPESLKKATEMFFTEMGKVEADPNYNFLVTMELEFYRKDGTTFWSENKFSLVRDENSKPLSILGEARDITERKQAEVTLKASEAQYRLISEHVNDVVRLIGMNGKPIYISPSAEKITGFTQQEAMELPWEKGMTPESYKLVTEAFSKELPRINAEPDYNPVIKLELEVYHKDGTTVWLEYNFSLLRDENGRPVSILSEGRNITDRKVAEEKLAKSYESLKKNLNDAINTMSKIVETRDPYTAGHQQRVAELAKATAREMKLENTQIDQIQTAAIIHDIGKMYVPSEILSKPGKLSDIEFDLIKTHSQAGYDIVKGMDFPGNVAEAILQHHERLDGSGYPNILKGDEILLEARILAVADVVEAMSSHRPYRPALGIDKALEEISKNRGKLYDPDVADVCVNLFKEQRFQFETI